MSTFFSTKDFRPQDWISQAEAARSRGVSRQAIYRLVKKGRFRTIEVGGRLLLNKADVKAYKADSPGRPKK